MDRDQPFVVMHAYCSLYNHFAIVGPLYEQQQQDGINCIRNFFSVERLIGLLWGGARPLWPGPYFSFGGLNWLCCAPLGMSFKHINDLCEREIDISNQDTLLKETLFCVGIFTILVLNKKCYTFWIRAVVAAIKINQKKWFVIFILPSLLLNT